MSPTIHQRGLKAYEPPKDLEEAQMRTNVWANSWADIIFPSYFSSAWVFSHGDMYSAPLEVDRELNEY